MTTKNQFLTLSTIAPVFACIVCACIPAHADTITGVAWSVPASTAENTPTLGNAPGPDATELATMTVSGIDFSGDGPGDYNLGGFLAYGGTLDSINYMNGASASTDLDDTLWEFTGTADFTTGQVFSVVHDDGVNLYVDGQLVLGDPGPTSPITSYYTYMGPSGNQTFDFIYTECCGGTADFQTDLVPITASPEPGSLVLFGFGGAAVLLAGFRKRLKRSN